MKLGVIIVTFNRLELLKECIKACLNQSEPFETILIVNNNSSDGTKEYLDNLKNEKIVIKHLLNNIGGAGGFYEGTKYFQESNLDFVLLIDDDAILNKDYNKYIKKQMEKDKNSILAYSGTVITDNEIQYNHRRHLKNIKKFKEMNSLPKEYKQDFFDYELSSFCGLYVSISLMNKIGLPNKEFFIWFDDTEYSLRILNYSKIRNINKSFLNHKTSIIENQSYSWKSYYGLRNQIYILKNYFPKNQLFRFIIPIYGHIVHGNILAFIKNVRYYKDIAGLYKNALRDGLKENLGKHSVYGPGYKIIEKSNK